MMNPSRPTSLTGSRARAGWLGTTLALAAALVVSSWTNYRAARGAVQTLNTGQAEIHAAALRSVEPRGGFDGDLTALQSVLESQSEAGLRYIALVESDGTVTASVGDSIGPLILPAAPEPGSRNALPALVTAGDRIRAFIQRPPNRGPFQQDRGDGGRFLNPAARESLRADVGLAIQNAQRDSANSGRFNRGAQQFNGPPSPQYYVMEFVPVPAADVMSQAVRGLFLNGVGAAILTIIALGFWRLSLGYDAAQTQIEQQRRLSQLGEMAAVLAHEIRNPLASLKGNAQLLAEALPSDSKDKRRVDRVVGEAVRLEALTTDLLDFARTAKISKSPADPAELLMGAVNDVAAGQILVDDTKAPATWPIDSARLRQALTNLLRNAWQMSPEGNPPVASIEQENGNLVFTVRDFGPGIEPAARERIFEPFYTTRTHGTGLGLPVAKRAVELHGGTLEAENHPEGGALFRIRLPNRGT
jgi:two-component system, NtrC family, sensor histidine kinase HydH